MIFRILLLILNCFISSILLFKTNNYGTFLFSIALLLLQYALIIKNLKRQKDNTISFIESLVSEDNTCYSLNSKSDFHKKIALTLESLNRNLLNKALEVEQKNDLIENILLHLKVGLIIYSSDGEISLINKSARILLSVSYITNIVQLKDLFKGSFNYITDFNKNINEAVEIDNIGTLLFESSVFEFNNKQTKILSIQDIKTTLSKNEQNSWSKVIRTLNHEIMNSIAPISSLASSSLILIDKSNYDLYSAIETIDRRSRNLLDFVDRYKSLSQIPLPNKKLCNINELIIKVKEVMKQYTEDIIFSSNIEEFIFIDPAQVEQILINIIKNSIEAGAHKIIISSEINESGFTNISIEDNGSGFSSEALENAFIPFYTTKDNGSGLGLSIIRQIMYLHGGEIKLSNLQSGTKVTLLFP